MKRERLEEIRRKTEAASPAPWAVEPCHRCDQIHVRDSGHTDPCGGSAQATAADLEFASLARTAIPELLAELDRYQRTEQLAQALGDQEEAVCATAARQLRVDIWGDGTTPKRRRKRSRVRPGSPLE